MNTRCFTSECTQTFRVHRKNNTFRGSWWRHCRRRPVLWQLVAILATPRHRQGARQRCCPFGKRWCVGKTYQIRYLSSNTRRPAPIGDRGPQPPANFGDFPSLESHSPGRGDQPPGLASGSQQNGTQPRRRHDTPPGLRPGRSKTRRSNGLSARRAILHPLACAGPHFQPEIPSNL